MLSLTCGLRDPLPRLGYLLEQSALLLGGSKGHHRPGLVGLRQRFHGADWLKAIRHEADSPLFFPAATEMIATSRRPLE